MMRNVAVLSTIATMRPRWPRIERLSRFVAATTMQSLLGGDVPYKAADR